MTNKKSKDKAMTNKKSNKKTQVVKSYIVSKAAQSVEYVGWVATKSGANTKGFAVMIKGGAGVVCRDTLKCPTGVITPVTADELEFLKNNSTFQRHMKAGFVHIKQTREDADDEAETPMTDDDGEPTKDGGAQITDEDFEKNGQEPPVIIDANNGKKGKKKK